jgi:acyl-CoA oxidase
MLRDPKVGGGVSISISNKNDWYELANQRAVLERRLAILVKIHMQDTAVGKDTSFSVHALTMAYCDVMYWKGLWEVIKGSNVDFNEQLVSLAQVVSVF